MKIFGGEKEEKNQHISESDFYSSTHIILRFQKNVKEILKSSSLLVNESQKKMIWWYNYGLIK